MTDGFTFVDLFAGIGGFHAALEGMGGECVLAVEYDEAAAQVYEANWGIDPRGDATEIDWAKRLEGTQVDVLAAGFPCQPFSKSGAQRGMDEARGTLFFNILEAAKALKPQVVLLENVRNLVGPRHIHEWEVILESLREIGYAVSSDPVLISPSWLSPEDGGAPQSRERVFILGTWVGPEKAADLAGMAKTVHLDRWPGEWDLARDLPLEGPGDGPGISAQERQWLQAWELFVQMARYQGVSLPGHPIWADVWLELLKPGGHAPWKERFIALNAEFFEANQSWIRPWLEGCRVADFPPSRRKFEWQAQDARGLRDCLIQLRPSGVRVKRATHTGTLVAIDQRPIVGALERRLNVRECARLQGFPDWFTFSAVEDRVAAKQLGNAVNVAAVRYALGQHLSNPWVASVLPAESALRRVGTPV